MDQESEKVGGQDVNMKDIKAIFNVKISSKELDELLLNYLIKDGVISDSEKKYFVGTTHDQGCSFVEFIVK